MSKKHLLWALVLANVLLSFASVGAEGLFGWTLPPALAAYRQEGSLWSISGAFRMVVLAVTVLAAFAAWIGLASFWRPARRLFLLSLGLDLFFRLIAGPLVIPSIGAVFRTLDSLAAGAIIGLVYFSDLARVFEPPAVRGTTGLQAEALRP